MTQETFVRAVGGALGTAAAPYLERGVTLLQAVAFAAGPVRLDDLVSATGSSRTDVAAVLARLERGGLVERDTAGRYVPGWLLHGLRREGGSSIEHAELALDERFAAFVSERLTEEVLAATHRREHADHLPGSVEEQRAERGLRLLHDLLLDLEVGVLPDDVTLQLLTRAYASHPDFDARWGRPSALLRDAGTPPPGRPAPRC